MQNELDVAIAAGAPVIFAVGCLIAAWRELPTHPEGRFTLATHVLAIGFVVPVAGLLLWSGFLGYPYLAFGNVGISGFLAGSSKQVALLNEGDWSLAPALTMLVLLEGAGQIPLAWFLLEGDWPRLEVVARLTAATVTTLLIVTSLVPLTRASILIPSVGLLAEVIAVLAFAGWQDQWLHEDFAAVPGG